MCVRNIVTFCASNPLLGGFFFTPFSPYYLVCSFFLYNNLNGSVALIHTPINPENSTDTVHTVYYSSRRGVVDSSRYPQHCLSSRFG